MGDNLFYASDLSNEITSQGDAMKTSHMMPKMTSPRSVIASIPQDTLLILIV